MNCFLKLLPFTLFMGELCRVMAVSFDQRQTGDLNVQIDLKNFKIFALTKGKEEYVDYDYAYDYSEMTIKPQNGVTTSKPLNANDTAQIDKVNTTDTTSSVTQLSELDTTTKTEINASITTEKVTTDSTAEASSVAVETTMVPHGTTRYSTGTTVTNTPSTGGNNETFAEKARAENNSTTSHTACKKGYYRNSKGNCELSIQNPSFNLLLKMLQKSKSAGGNEDKKF